jgi:hypothetical protein
MTEVGKLKRVPLREVWPHEAYDFTLWLQDNLDVLNDVLGLELVSAEREKSTGSFNIDLLAEDTGGHPVIIENQLERSDHEHLGKVITYLASIGADVAVWIVADPRPEHVSAVSWLNESSSGSFYLVKVEAVQIGESAPAPLLTLIVGPSIESREVGETKREFTERHHLRYDFWTGLLEHARDRTKLHANVSPSHDAWLAAGAGISGVGYHYVIRQHDCRVELYMSRSEAAENKAIFDQLYAQKEQIEVRFGEPLTWERLDSKTASRIRKDTDIGGYRDENWAETYETLIDMMIRFEAALRPHMKRVKVQG